MIITSSAYKILLNGQNVSSQFLTNLRSIIVHQQLNKPTFVEIQIAYDYYFDFKEKLNSGTPIDVFLPVQGNPLKVFSGYIHSVLHETDVFFGSVIRLLCYDYLNALSFRKSTVLSQEQSFTEYIKKITLSEHFELKKHGFPSVEENIIEIANSDLDLLQDLANEYGFYFYLKEKILHIFFPDSNPFKEFTIEIEPLLPHIISNEFLDSRVPNEIMVYWMRESAKESHSVNEQELEPYYGGKGLMDGENMEKSNSKGSFSSSYLKKQRDYNKIFFSSSHKRSFSEQMEIKIPGNPELHPGRKIIFKDSRLFYDSAFLMKTEHRLDEYGMTSVLYCTMNARRG